MCEKIPFCPRSFHPNTFNTSHFIQNCEKRRQTHLDKTIEQIRTNYARRKHLYMLERSDWKPGKRDNLRDFRRFRDGPYSSSIIVAQSPTRPHGIWFLPRKNLAMQKHYRKPAQHLLSVKCTSPLRVNPHILDMHQVRPQCVDRHTR